jgi:hypothetical protein
MPGPTDELALLVLSAAFRHDDYDYQHIALELESPGEPTSEASSLNTPLGGDGNATSTSREQPPSASTINPVTQNVSNISNSNSSNISNSSSISISAGMLPASQAPPQQQQPVQATVEAPSLRGTAPPLLLQDDGAVNRTTSEHNASIRMKHR